MCFLTHYSFRLPLLFGCLKEEREESNSHNTTIVCTNHFHRSKTQLGSWNRLQEQPEKLKLKRLCLKCVFGLLLLWYDLFDVGFVLSKYRLPKLKPLQLNDKQNILTSPKCSLLCPEEFESVTSVLSWFKLFWLHCHRRKIRSLKSHHKVSFGNECFKNLHSWQTCYHYHF